MILRRVIAHVKNQHWTAVFLDFVIVVAGVFIGIQVSNWNDEREDRRTETEYLTQLQVDLHNIEREINAQIEFEQFQANLATGLFDLIRDDVSKSRAQKINMGLNQLTVRRTLRVQSPTFLDLQSSGNLKLISDPALRTAIISYFYRTTRLEAAIDKNNIFFVDQGFNEFIRSKNVTARAWDSGLMKQQLPSSVELSSAFTESTKASRLYNITAAFLDAAPEAMIWEEMISQLTWRGTIAINNEGIAVRLGDETKALSTKLAHRLEERTP
ncbi:MAG: hypothetical protein R3C51_01130 [Parvularculaceae bacterium]